MANEIRATYDIGETLYALVFNAAGEVWRNNAPQQFLAYAPGAIGVYDIPLSEIATTSGQYRATWPDHANMIGGIYSVVLFLQAGGGPDSVNDTRIGVTATMYWDGTAEITHNMIDTVLDTIAVDVDGINGEAMRGTDGVSLVIPDAAGVVEAYLLSDVIGADGDTLEILSDESDAVKADTAAILLDTDTMEADLKTYMLSDIIGADADTLETLSDQLDVLGAGSGGTEETYTVTDDVTGFPIDGVHVWVSTDLAGANIIWDGFTNAAGVVKYYHDLVTGTTVYLWREVAGYSFVNPDSENTS